MTNLLLQLLRRAIVLLQYTVFEFGNKLAVLCLVASMSHAELLLRILQRHSSLGKISINTGLVLAQFRNLPCAS